MGAAPTCLAHGQERLALGHDRHLVCRQAQMATSWRRANG